MTQTVSDAFIILSAAGGIIAAIIVITLAYLRHKTVWVIAFLSPHALNYYTEQVETMQLGQYFQYNLAIDCIPFMLLWLYCTAINGS